MFLFLRRVSQCHSNLLKQSFRFSTKKYSEELVEMHRSIISTRIIKLIQENPYKDFKMTENQISQPLLQMEQNSTNINSNMKEQKKDEKSEQNFTKFQPYPSLRSQIVNLIHQYSNSQTTSNPSQQNLAQVQIAKQKMLSFFEEGVWVHQDLCSQQRFDPDTTSYQNLLKTNQKVEEPPFQFQSDQQKQKLKKKKENQYKKLIFCPTYLVTGQIFRHFKLKRKYLLITGQFGSGKSYSFILYRLLSDIIFRYKHSYCPEEQNLPSEIDLTQIPKLVYWSINLSKIQNIQDAEKQIEEIIMRQCYELKKYYPNYKILNKKIQEMTAKEIFFQLGIYSILVVDQINDLASALREFEKYNNYKSQLEDTEKYKKLQSEALTMQDKKKQFEEHKKEIQKKLEGKFGDLNKLKKRIDIAYKVDQILNKSRFQFKKVYYLTSKLIERRQLIKLNLNYEYKHSMIKMSELQYQELLSLPPTTSDFAQFIIFMLKQKHKQNFNNRNLTEKQQKIFQLAKKQLFKILDQSYFLILPLAVYKLFDQDSSYLNNMIKSQQNKTDLNASLTQLIQSLNTKSSNQIRQQIKRFLEKSQTIEFRQVWKLKRILLLKLLYAAKTKIIQRRENPSLPLNEPLVIRLPSQDKQLQSQVQERLDRNLFRYNGIKFQCLVHEQVIEKILSAMQEELIKGLLESDEKIYSLIETKVGKGLFIESRIRDSLTKGGTDFKYKIVKNKKLKQQESIQLPSVNELKKYFRPIPKKNAKDYKNFYFLEDFKNTLDKINVGVHLFLPQLRKNKNQPQKKKKTQQIDESSKIIDFVLCFKQNYAVTITVFDVTLSQKLMNKKLVQFFIQLANFQEHQEQSINISGKLRRVWLNYVVLVPQLLTIQPINWSEKISKAIKNINSQFKQEQERMKQNQLPPPNIKLLNKKINFLKKLEKNLNGYDYYCQARRSDDIQSKSNFKSMFKSMAVSSFFDATLSNPDPSKISLNVRLLKRAKEEYYNEPQEPQEPQE